jgi:DNA-binding GntR family transcriptional regulator
MKRILTKIDRRPDQKQQVVDGLKEDLALGRLLPRQRLQEEELADRFDVGRHFIRSALADLETQGIVVRHPNKGASIRAYSLHEVNNLYEVRELLENHATMLIPLPVPGKVIEQLIAVQVDQVDAIDAGDIPRVLRHDRLFHRMVFNICENPLLVDAVENYMARSLVVETCVLSNRQMLRQAHDQHVQIIDALRGSAHSELIRRISEHRNLPKQIYLAEFEGRQSR